MSEYKAVVRWNRTGPDFVAGKYSREHVWSFDGGAVIPASASSHGVPAPWSNPAHVDPEEAFVASIASCHLLTFLWLAAKAGFQADRYEDSATGLMTANERGVPWVSKVILEPRIEWSGERIPTSFEVEELHHHAHEQCYIAASVKTEIEIKIISGHPGS